MELIGDEKRIRALFSELRFADEQTAPSFTSVWSRAQSRSMQPRRAFNLSFVAATVLICALVSLAVWSKYSQRNAMPNVAVTPPSVETTPSPKPKEGALAADKLTKDDQRSAQLAKSRRAKLAAQHQALLAANRKAAQEAKEITSWQSPTATLLSSPNDDIFKSLPQLNENANELKSFLPSRANEKEK